MSRLRGLGSRFPIIAMSGDLVRGTTTSVLNMSSHLGAGATLTKPFAPEELKATLERLLASSPNAAARPDARAGS
jgi:DNA-binding response OmpR family regulator